MKREETFIMQHTGRILIALGIFGVVFTFYFDDIIGRASFYLGPIQILGMVVFSSLSLFGIAVERFLQTVKDLLDK